MRERRRSRTGAGLRAGLWLLLLLAFAATASRARAADLAEARKLFNTGKYAECVAVCDEAISDNRLDEGWYLLKIRAELTTGLYQKALERYQAAT
jgi:hypothetical protein